MDRQPRTLVSLYGGWSKWNLRNGKKNQMQLSCTAIAYISLCGLTSISPRAPVTGTGSKYRRSHGDDSDY